MKFLPEPWIRHLFFLPHFLHTFPSIYTFVWSSTLYSLVFWRRIVLSPHVPAGVRSQPKPLCRQNNRLCLCLILHQHAEPCHVKHLRWYAWKIEIVQWLSAVRQNKTGATLNSVAWLSWSKSFIASFACGPCVYANSSYTLIPFSSVLIS